MAESACSDLSIPVSQEESPPSSIANSVHNLTLTSKSSRVPVSFQKVGKMIQGCVLFKDTRKESVESLPKKTYREMPNWTSDEYQALMSLLSWSSCACKDPKFWAEAAVFVQQQTKSFYCRSGIKLACIHQQYSPSVRSKLDYSQCSATFRKKVPTCCFCIVSWWLSIRNSQSL